MRLTTPVFIICALTLLPVAAVAQGGAPGAQQPPAEERPQPRSYPPLAGFPTIPMTVEEFQLMVPEITGKSVSGVGLLPLLSMDKNVESGEMVIVTPVRESPAARAGLHAGDVLETVSGMKVRDLSLPDLMELLRGDAGTPVPITLRRGDEVVPVELTRRNLPARETMVTSRVVETRGVRVGYVALEMFTSEAVEQLGLALTVLGTQKVDALVLDLRDNPGGALPASLGVIGYFTGPVRVGGILRMKGLITELEATGIEIVTLPTAVLVNEGTASAAELTAIALQEVAGATVVGMPTFGKGLIHELRGVPEGDGVQLVSTGRLRSIQGRDILTQGVRPDHPVPLAPSPLLGLGVEPASEGDLQFQEAITALKFPGSK